MDKLSQNSDLLSPTLSTISDAKNRVFDLELIREKILDYAIHEKGIVETSNVKSCRLVSKAWHQSTSRVLRKSMEPLFKFGSTFPSVDLNKPEGEEQLHQFLKSVTEGVRLEDHVPPHSICTFLKDSDTSENRKTVLECFVNCGCSLIELSLHICVACNYNFMTTNVSFPKLRIFNTFVFGNLDSNTRSKMGDKIDFTQRILTSSQQLKSFAMFMPCDSPELARHIGNLILPPSITDMKLYSMLNETAIEILIRNPLPNLKALVFNVTGLPFENEGIFTRILENVGKKLEKFNVCGKGAMIARGSRTTFVLPLMENLQAFSISDTNLELGGYPSSLQRFLPLLKEMTLKSQTIPSLHKWIATSSFQSVTSLTVSLCTERRLLLQLGDANSHNIDSTMMRAIRTAFPNLLKLDIALPRLDLQDPTLCILWEIKNLTSLRVEVENTTQILTPDFIDALLIGISVEDVPKLRNSPALWEDLHEGNISSIRNLNDLEQLELVSGQMHGQLISDLTFDFALFKIPKLRLLILENGFFVSEEMQRKWTQDGRQLINLN